MLSTGIDIGSSNIKIAVIENGLIIDLKKTSTGFNPVEKCRELLGDNINGTVKATGYGRHLAQKAFNCGTVSEISAFAKGAVFFNPEVRTVVDVGGQDSKVIRCNRSGEVLSFEMNDKCAAGTGRFLEIMARALEMTQTEFGNIKPSNSKSIKISSICTVFAESEVISMVGKGESKENIGYALHEMAVERVCSLTNRVGVDGTVSFAGGCAYDRLFVQLLAKKLNRDIFVSAQPEFTGAVGAALLSAG
ncbi:3-hydroxyacyl-ACP dehydratase [bacterium]|jgi:predicted CoA-substrate-specific enzyme activase|nr:3-hydroxyacyl-ACP dehydratase [bacterium]MDX9806020.1 acyl-CoA dehydratase activase [bacterium]